ncbi:helix-turn-helix domain-containing protein [Actinobaculum suis]|uniref:helix-turn-helix domain-containing protein n=1 Tax=Actinobaculum suis TaxID=1657 RepID=UPI00163C0B2A
MSTQAVTKNQISLRERVAANIRARAGVANLSRADIARIMNVSKPTIGRKWNGASAWSFEDLEDLALIFDVEPWELVKPLAYENGPESASKLQAVPDQYTARDSNPQPTD